MINKEETEDEELLELLENITPAEVYFFKEKYNQKFKNISLNNTSAEILYCAKIKKQYILQKNKGDT